MPKLNADLRILAVSDMHGDLQPVRDLLDFQTPDLLICCGDWGDPEQVDRSEYEEIISWVPVLSVFGNHDDLDLLRSLTNQDGSPVLLENGAVREIGDVRIAGISGIWAKSHRKPWYITDDEVRTLGESLRGKGIDIMMTHGCAIGLCDTVPGGTHGGHRSFLDAVEAVKPAVYLCGHLHLHQTRTLKDGRLAANIGNTAEGDYLILQRAGGVWSFETGAR